MRMIYFSGGQNASFLVGYPIVTPRIIRHTFDHYKQSNNPRYTGVQAIRRCRKYSEIVPARHDKHSVSRFVDNAAQILDAAENAVRTGHAPSDMTILITQEGGIRMLADSDWPLDSLQAETGAKMAYRVSQSASVVRVEGRAGSRTCLFETAKPERVARLLLNRAPSYGAPPLLLAASQAGVA
jgi:hypothetical protein